MAFAADLRLVSLAASVYADAVLNLTPPEALTDPQGRPYFLWDCDLTLTELEERLRDPDPTVQAYFVAKLMRQAKPDDVFRFVTLVKVRTLWPTLVLPHRRSANVRPDSECGSTDAYRCGVLAPRY